MVANAGAADGAEARRLVEAARLAGVCVAVAESLTGGLVAAAMTAIPGASDVFLGGIVAYAPSVKADVLGVDPGVLASFGVVSAPTAVAMAEGVRRLVRADVAVATTGVAGPAWHDGKEPGTVVVAGVGAGDPVVVELSIDGDRADVMSEATRVAISVLITIVERQGGSGTRVG